MNFLTAPFDSLGPKTPVFNEFINLAERKCRVRFSLGTRYMGNFTSTVEGQNFKTTQNGVSWTKAGDIVDRKSTTGYEIRMYGNRVYWKSKKQDIVTKSSTEADRLRRQYV